MDKEKNNLLHRPALSPEKHYDSDADFKRSVASIPNLPTDETTVDDEPERIREELEEVYELIEQALPEPIKFIGETVKKLIDRSKIVWKDGKIPVHKPKEYIPPVDTQKKDDSVIRYVPKESGLSLKGLPELFPDPLSINIKLEVPRTLVQIIQDDYARDQIQLNRYYLQQLQLVMQKYFQQMLMAMADCGLSDINDLTEEFDGSYVKIPTGQSLEHLRDGIVKMQILRNQKTRLFRKTHSVDNTLIHLRSWHAAEQQRERYYKEKYRDSGTYTESHSNALLREARSSYDKAYASSLYDMYKYMNSSVILMNDILEITVKEAQAKAMLLKSGVNIFDRPPLELGAEAGGIAGNSGQAGDGKGSGFDEAAVAEKRTDAGSEKNDSVPVNRESAEEHSSAAPTGIFSDIGKRIMTGVGGGFGGAVAGAAATNYLEKLDRKSAKIGGLRITKNGISYGDISYDGKAVTYKRVLRDGLKDTISSSMSGPNAEVFEMIMKKSHETTNSPEAKERVKRAEEVKKQMQVLRAERGTLERAKADDYTANKRRMEIDEELARLTVAYNNAGKS